MASKSQCTYYNLGECEHFHSRCFDCREYDVNPKYYNPNNKNTLSNYGGTKSKPKWKKKKRQALSCIRKFRKNI